MWMLLLYAVTNGPHVSGAVDIDPPQGIIEAQLCVEGFAPQGQPRFLLNAALNVKVVTDAEGTGLPYAGDFNGRMVGEAREYVVRRRADAEPLTKLCVSYRGAVPVFETNSAADDWKGRIVAGFGALRASEQSKWYPVVVDSVSERSTTRDIRYSG